MKKTVAVVIFLFAIFLSITACKQPTDNKPDMRPPVINGSVTANPASLTLPADSDESITLNCSATNADGTTPVKSTVWSVKDKPAGANVTINGSTASGLTVAGTYKFGVTVTGTNDKTATGEVTVNANLDATVNFEPLAASFPVTTIDFSPSNLPEGVTYTLTDGTNTWNSASGFNGQVTSTGLYDSPKEATFTQLFYLNEEIQVGNRTVVVNFNSSLGGRFTSLLSDTGENGINLRYNP
jgi:hypothetical protein